MFKKLFNKKRKLSDFFPEGFHGDKYLIKLVSNCLKQSEIFIETGTNVGSTLVHVSKDFPNITAYSCEPDKEAFELALSKTKNFKNTHIYKELSPNMIYRITKENPSLLSKNTVFWLDAHDYGYQWPLKDEISFITKNFKQGYIFIDDFKVPHLDCFKWNRYQNQTCSFDYIKNSINPDITYNLYYPNYTEKTSRHHPLVGWGMIDFGHSVKLSVPKSIEAKIYKAF
jgi:hypothetical protein